MKTIALILSFLPLGLWASNKSPELKLDKKEKQKELKAQDNRALEIQQLEAELVRTDEKLAKAPNDIDLLSNKASLLFELSRFLEAEQVIDQAILQRPEPKNEANLTAGKIYFSVGDYENSIRFLSLFTRAVGERQAEKTGAASWLANAEFASNEMRTPKLVQVKNLSDLNSGFNESNVVISPDGSRIFFTSDRPLQGKAEDVQRLYYSDWNTLSNTWGDVKLYTPEKSLVGVYAHGGFAPDGKSYFLIASDSSKMDDILYVNFNTKKGVYDKAIRLEDNVNSDAMETSVSITAEKKRLFYSSNSLDGQRNSDIFWSAAIGKNEWTPGVRLGDEINTDKEEKNVYRLPDGKKLFFVSNGHPGFGGFDIFLSETNGDKLGRPFNLGSPINSNYNEFDFNFSPNGEWLFFTSDRPDGKGGKDMYMVNLNEYRILEVEASKQVKGDIQGRVINASGKAIANQAIAIYDDNTDKLIATTSSDDNGFYSCRLHVGGVYKFKIQYNDEPELLEKISLKPGISGSPVVTKNLSVGK